MCIRDRYILVREINEPKDVPKAMGLLSSSIAVGGFVGSIIAGILTDMGFLNIAIMFPAIPLIIGVLLIGMNLPNKKQEGKVNVDVPGIVALTIALSGILLALNYGPRKMCIRDRLPGKRTIQSFHHSGF